jgi:signal transduction histidine kinase
MAYGLVSASEWGMMAGSSDKKWSTTVKMVLRINIVMLISFVLGTGVCLWAVRTSAPALNWTVVVGVYVLFSLYSLVTLGLFATGRWTALELLGDHLILSNRTIWFANLSIIGGLWLLFPYASLALRYVYVILSMTATSGFMLVSITRPPSRRFVWLSPSMISLSNALFWLVYREAYWFIIVSINLALCTAFLLGKWQLQAIMQDAYEARIAAENARAQVEEERDAKSRFLASASHDLGQPIQSARLFFDQVVRGTDATRRAKAAAQAESAFAVIERQLHKMIEHLKLDADDVKPRLALFPVGPVIARVASLAEAQAAQAGVSIHALPSHLPVLSDADLLERALANLIDNAIRHAGASRVLIGARPRNGRVRIWVVDDGRGVAISDSERLFDDYVQGSDHGDEVRGGFGLGLASVRRIVALLGGACGLDRRWAGGAAFFLELPEIARQT